MIIDDIENKRKILEKFLEICAFEGISESTLQHAMNLCEIDAKFKNIIFENGVLDLIEFYIDENNQKLAKIVKNTENFADFKIRDKIKFCLYNLFELQKNHQMAILRIANFYFDIRNFSLKIDDSKGKYGAKPLTMAFTNAGKIADFIWKTINDNSTDFNYYTKRLTLSKIIISTFWVFVKDNTTNLSKTKSHIDAEVEKVMKFEKFKAKIGKFSTNLINHTCELFVDDKGEIKDFKKIIKNLPFIRLLKK